MIRGEISWEIRLQRQSDSEGYVQKRSQRQRVDAEPHVEIHENIMHPRGAPIGQYRCRAYGEKLLWATL